MEHATNYVEHLDDTLHVTHHVECIVCSVCHAPCGTSWQYGVAGQAGGPANATPRPIPPTALPMSGSRAGLLLSSEQRILCRVRGNGKRRKRSGQMHVEKACRNRKGAFRHLWAAACLQHTALEVHPC
eukprot:1150799-Pelagomonas_calceolata.AAC.4